MADHDISDALREQVADAVAQGTSLCISGGNSKAFYGHRTDRVNHHPLRVEEHRGITNYQPSELTLTARAGTPLADIRAELDAAGQMLPFDPPALDGVNGQVATLGGTLACGFSGPARPFAGSCRDYVLGTRIINGRAQSLRFGGEVMKNVAGYDLSRLMVGALGTFGVILDASLKVLPKPAVTRSFSAVCSPEEALAHANWAATRPGSSAATNPSFRIFSRLNGNCTSGSRPPSIPRGCSTPAAWRQGCHNANHAPRRYPQDRSRPPCRIRAQGLCALRLLPCNLPDLQAHRQRARQPTWAHLPDQERARRGRTQHAYPTAPRPLPDLPQLRDDLPIGGPVCKPARHRPGRARTLSRAALARKAAALVACDLRRRAATDDAGHACRPVVATAVARLAQEPRTTARCTGRTSTRTPQPTRDHARRLRAVGGHAQHQRRHQPGTRQDRRQRR